MRQVQMLVMALVVAAVAVVAVPRTVTAMTDPSSCCVCTGCAVEATCVAPFGDSCVFCIVGGCSGADLVSQPCLTVPGCPQFSPVTTAPTMTRWGLSITAVLLIALGLHQIYRRKSLVARALLLVAITYVCGVAVYAGFRLRGGGTWMADVEAHLTQAATEPHRWTIDAERGENGSLTGTLTLSGSPNLTAATFDGQISGETVTGTIAQGGQPIATITGTINGGQITGQYTTSWGEAGAFDWDTAPFE